MGTSFVRCLTSKYFLQPSHSPKNAFEGEGGFNFDEIQFIILLFYGSCYI